MKHAAPSSISGHFADGFEHVVNVFAEQVEKKTEVGASLCVYHQGKPVVDVWGGFADAKTKKPWESDSRLIVFSATKGLSAMGFHLAAARGLFEWDAPVAQYWPGFAENGKERITVRALLNHTSGLAAIDLPLSFEDCSERTPKLLHALESQRPGEALQGYHGISWGLYAGELFDRIAGEDLSGYLKRELFEPLQSDARMVDGPAEDAKTATLYAPQLGARAAHMTRRALFAPLSAESRILRKLRDKKSLSRRAFENPAIGTSGPLVYNTPEARRACLPWGGATSSARGLARAYRPFVEGGEVDGRRYFPEASVAPLLGRQSWSYLDQVLQKPVGWSQGFLKEERHVFCPNTGSFGHAGMGGSLGWADPTTGTSMGYVMNRMDWRVRSARAVHLCHALYDCEPLRG